MSVLSFGEDGADAGSGLGEESGGFGELDEEGLGFEGDFRVGIAAAVDKGLDEFGLGVVGGFEGGIESVRFKEGADGDGGRGGEFKSGGRNGREV
jgi:hypothetical protein